jgi:hypothetical protein
LTNGCTASLTASAKRAASLSDSDAIRAFQAKSVKIWMLQAFDVVDSRTSRTLRSRVDHLA